LSRSNKDPEGLDTVYDQCQEVRTGKCRHAMLGPGGLRTSLVRRSLNHMCVHTFGQLSHGKVLAHSHFFWGHSQKSRRIHTFLSADSQLLVGHSNFTHMLTALSNFSQPAYVTNVHQNHVLGSTIMTMLHDDSECSYSYYYYYSI
jgi:hypothetical protein